MKKTRICRECRLEKTMDRYSTSNSTDTMCRDCRNAEGRDKYKANIVERRKKARDDYHKNKNKNKNENKNKK